MTEDAWDIKLAATEEFFGAATYWLAHPLLKQLYSRVASPARGDWFGDLLELATTGTKSPQLLSIGCGLANLERDWLAEGRISSLITVDPSLFSFQTQIAHAAEYAGRWKPILGTAESLEPGLAADLVLFNMSLHHCSDVQLALRNARSVVENAGGGFVVANEYVGPSRFDFGEYDRLTLRKMFQTIPPRLRKLCVEPFTELEAFAFPDPAMVQSVDPTEAPQSDRIRAIFYSTFDVIKDIALPGTFFQFGLNNITGNFKTADEEAMEVLLRLFQQEQAFFSQSSHFRLLVGKVGS